MRMMRNCLSLVFQSRRRAVSAILVMAFMLSMGALSFAQVPAENQTEDFSAIIPNPQGLPFRIQVREYDFGGQPLPILQSYVVGVSNGRWLVFAGRTNGLHNFTEDGFLNFPPDKQNREAWVIDVAARQSWGRSLEDASSGLSQSQIDSLSLTNTQYYQDGSTLYVAGGYGYDRAQEKFMTYDTLTAVDIPGMMDWVINGQGSALENIRQINNDIVRVTGGDMFKMGQTTFLVFGQDFEGPYIPTSNGTYTKQVRSFLIQDDGVTLAIADTFRTPEVDAYRRRDLNTVPVLRRNDITQTLEEGLVALSGVFTLTAGAWTVPVEIDQFGNPTMADPSLPETFKQGMNNYHSSTLEFFSESSNDMFLVLFGGITLQFYDRDVEQFIYFNSINPNFLPWTSQITTVKIDAEGNYTQYLMDGEFPPIMVDGKRLFFGAESEFIPVQDVDLYANGVLKLDSLVGKEKVIGYIYGGIATNGFAVGLDNTTTNATNHIFEVSITPAVVSKRGIWHNPDEPGMIYNIDVQGDQLVIVWNAYDEATGEPSWLISGGNLTDSNNYTGQLLKFTNGQAFTAPFTGPPTSEVVGDISITFQSETKATINALGVTLNIQRFVFDF